MKFEEIILSKTVKIILLFIIIFIYTYSLDKVPVHLNRDELGFSLNAYSIVKTGFDENGRFLPLYFWHLGVMWSTPIIVYLTALFLTVLPLSEITIRLPSILVGFLNIILIYFLAKKLFDSRRFGLLAAAFLALTPIHFIQSRILLDNLFPVPFILGWMLLLRLFVLRQNLIFLFLATFLLGVGVHSYHATKVMMPIYLIFTILIAFFSNAQEVSFKSRNKLIILSCIAGFILPLLPLIPWLSKYPDTLTDQVRYTGLYDTKLSPLEGIATLLKPEIVSQRLGVYISYFDPSFLFSKGDSSLIHSTGRIGVFLLSFIFLLPIGIYQAFKKRNWFTVLIVAGFFTAPFAASLVGNEYRASKELFILPFAALLATLAIQFLLNITQKAGKLLAVVLLAASIVQFAYFLNDYFISYRGRSYVWFDYDILGAQDAVLSEENIKPSNVIYFDNRIYYYTDRYWKFNLIKYKREDLISKTIFFDPLSSGIQLLQPNSIVLSRFDHTGSLQKPQFELTKKVLEPDRFTSFYIYRTEKK